ncbi:RHS repeat-associated core domain-containing protein [Vibrio sp. WXL103]|uniref:RHS repeat-associated core domain-containing protein n=1 Tax=Vibrio sp. WXL103 TaxID=3450710 RepID=UPI003EC7C655
MNGLTPELGIRYTQGGANTTLGLAFELSGLSVITRCTQTKQVDGVRGGIGLNEKDVYCLDGKRLHLISGKLGKGGSHYLVDDQWQTKVVAIGNQDSGPQSWTVYSSSGFITHYGTSLHSKQDVEGHGLVWKISTQKDRFNNQINYSYEEREGFLYLKALEYSDVKIAFLYVSRPDVMTNHYFGKSSTLGRLLEAVVVKRAGRKFREFKLSYDTVKLQGKPWSRLASIKACSQLDCTRPHLFEWAESESYFSEPVEKTLFLLDEFRGFITGDLNRDGMNDICYLTDELYCSLNQANASFSAPKRWSRDFFGGDWNKPEDIASLALIDINNDSYVDVCGANQHGYYCALNAKGVRFLPGRYWTEQFSISDYLRLVDINTDGLIDLCTLDSEQLTCLYNTGDKFSQRAVLSRAGFTLEKVYSSASFLTVTKDFDPVKMPQVPLVDINKDGYPDFCGVELTGDFNCLLGHRNAQGQLMLSDKVTWAEGLPIGLILDADIYVTEDQYRSDKAKIEALQRTLKVIDITGDALPDLCYRLGQEYLCRVNHGDRFGAAQVWLRFNSQHWNSNHLNSAREGSLRLVDKNHDGLADLCYIVADKVFCGYGNGERFNRVSEYTTITPDLDKLHEKVKYSENYIKKIFGIKTTVHALAVNNVYGPYKQGVDLTKDGVAGDCYRSIKGLACIDQEITPLALLTQVSTAFGKLTKFRYQSTNEGNVFQPKDFVAPLFGVKPSITVVSELEQSDGVGGLNRSAYSYFGFAAHPELGMLGFNEIHVDDVLHQKKQISLNGYDHNWSPYLSKTETWIQGVKVGQIEFHYQSAPSPVLGRLWFQLKEKQQINWGLGGELLTRKKTQYKDYDRYGYPKVTKVKTEDQNGGVFLETTNTEYRHLPYRWLLGKPSKISVTKSNGYDTQTRHTEFEYDPKTGALLTQTIAPDHPLALRTNFTYNSRGFRVSEVTSGAGGERGSKTQYDDQGRIIKHTNPLGHSVVTKYHPLCAKPSAVTDANGLTTRFKYDDYCRETKQLFPDGSWLETWFEWSDGADVGIDPYGLALSDRSITMVTKQTSNGSSARSYFDRFGREVRKVTVNDEGNDLVVDKVFDSQGQLVAETLPYIHHLSYHEPQYWIKHTFDGLGRPISHSRPTIKGDEIVTELAYHGLEVRIVEPGGRERRERANGLGQRVEVVENESSVIEYQYDAFSNLIRTNVNGLVTLMTYDSLGNKVETADPAMGTWRYGYNAWGELTWQLDAKQQRVEFHYDQIGRKIQEKRGDRVSAWQYDQAFKGKLDKRYTKGNARGYRYDELGRMSSMTLTIDGKDYLTQYQYGEGSRLNRVTYPSGMKVDRQYDVNGNLKRLSIPKSDIWDSQYVQLELALEETSARIAQLEMRAYELENKAQFYIQESERLRQAAQQLVKQSDKYEKQAIELNNHARSLFKLASVNLDKASSYRESANYFWQTFGNRVFKLYKTKGGYAQYKYEKCKKKDFKGNCKKKDVFTSQVPVWMVKVGYCIQLKGNTRCYSGPRRSVNLTHVYNQWADHYQVLADTQQAEARIEKAKAKTKTQQANLASEKAAKMTEKAKQFAKLAKNQTQLLAKLTDELDSLIKTESELQQILDDRLKDETEQVIWLATKRDNFGRVSGELFGNGFVTLKEVDHAQGRVARITASLGKNKRYDVRYTYDQRGNVISKSNLSLQREQHYQYDAFNRLVNWEFADAKQNTYYSRGYQYDVYGNLLSKTGQERFEVEPSGLLKGSMTYDANGNLISGKGRKIKWSSFNKATQINDNGDVVRFEYGSEQERVKQRTGQATTIYVSSEYQVVTSVDAKGKEVISMHHRFLADNQMVAEHVKTLLSGQKQIDKTAYFHTDALGSAELISDTNGVIQIERGYTPFGEKLAELELSSPPLFSSRQMRGFTGHEYVAGGTLVNMNARLYDPQLGRFLSADSFVQDPSMSQSYNRYSYVLNNPVKYTDPTGHFWELAAIGFAIFVGSQTFGDPAIQQIGAIVGTTLMSFGAAGIFSGLGEVAQYAASGASTSFVSNIVVTGDLESAASAAAIGGASAMITHALAHNTSLSPFADGQQWHSALPLAHGVAQGGIHELQGGEFKQGFISGVVGKFGGRVVHSTFNESQVYEQMAGMAVVSSVAAVASGANSRDAVMRSAVSSLTIYLYNDIARMRIMNKRAENDVGLLESIEWKKTMVAISNVSSQVTTVCVMRANVYCVAIFGTASLSTAGIAVAIDMLDGGDFNEVSAAGFTNSFATMKVSKKVIGTLPARYEVPALIVFDSYGHISTFLFNEASENAKKQND